MEVAYGRIVLLSDRDQTVRQGKHDFSAANNVCERPESRGRVLDLRPIIGANTRLLPGL